MLFCSSREACNGLSKPAITGQQPPTFRTVNSTDDGFSQVVPALQQHALALDPQKNGMAIDVTGDDKRANVRIQDVKCRLIMLG